MESMEYEFQLFGLTVQQQSLERRLAVRKMLDDALESIIKKTCPFGETMRLLQDKKKSVCEEILLAMDENFKCLEALDKKAFTIPKHVLLETDFSLKKNPEVSEDDLDKEISNLTEMYLESTVFRCLLEIEEDKIMAIMPYLANELQFYDQVNQSIAHIDHASSINDQVKDLMDNLKLED